MSDMEQITGKRILVTGVTGWVAGPVAAALAANGNTVFGAARFRDADATREPLEAQGVNTISIDLASGRFDEVPADIDLVLQLRRREGQQLRSRLRAPTPRARPS